MTLISVSKAAKLFDVSRPTLQKALKEGMITGEKVMAGGSESWQIDTAELARLYNLRNPNDGNLPGKEAATGQHIAVEKSDDNGNLSPEIVRGLEARLQAAQSELDTLRTGKAEVERELAAAQAVAEERRRILDDMTKRLTKSDDQTPRRGLWSKLFKGR